MITEIKLSPRTTVLGAGIYEVVSEVSYVKLLVTDLGHVMPVNHRVITEEDLLTAYSWGREEGQAECQ